MNTNGVRPGSRGALHSAAAVLLVAFAAGCGGGDSTGTSDVPPGFISSNVTIAVSPNSLVLVQGKSVTTTVTVTRNGSGSQKTIDLVIPGLPTGVTATFNPASLPSGVSSSVLTFAAAIDANIVTVTPGVLALIGGDTLAIDGPPPAITLQIKNARPGIFVAKAGSGSGTVTSAPAGVNCGTTCGAQFDALTPITLTAVPATGSVFTSWSGVCVGTALTCTFTPNDFGNTVTATFTSTAPAIGLSVSPSPVSVQAGASTTATATVARINGFADPVSLSVNAPTGLTVTPNPTSVTGTTSTLTIAAAASLAAGSYQVTVTGTGTGVTQQSTTFAVQVTPGASGGSTTFNYAACETNQTPVWFAVQNGSGPWTRVTPTNNAFTFTMSGPGAVATVTKNGTEFQTLVLYGTAAEITSIAIANPCGEAATGTKHVSGTFANSGDSTFTVNMVIGGAQFTKPTNSNSFSLTNVPKGPRDLIALRTLPSAPSQDRMVLRRSTNYATNTTIPNVDFGPSSTDAFSTIYGGVLVPNVGTDQGQAEVSLITVNGESESYYTFAEDQRPNLGFKYVGLPDAQLQPGDFHHYSFVAAPPSGGTTFRFIQLLQHSAKVQTISLGPPLATAPVVTALAAAPYLRLRAQIPAQTTYTAGANAVFSQNANSVQVRMTAGYLGSAPTTWTLDIPDLSAAGYDVTWALKSGTGASWSVIAAGGNVLPFVGGTPVDNAQIVGAGAQDSSSSFPASIRGLLVRRRHP